MTLISALFLIFIFSIQTIEATGPKDLNPEKTKADANLSQSSAASGAKNKIDLKKDPAKMKKDLEKQKQALLKQIILEDASSLKSLNKTEKQAIKSELGISENDFILKGLKITVEDDQLKIAGALKDFIANPENITKLFDDTLFKNKLFEYLKAKNPYLDASFKIDIKIINKNDGEFIISVYQVQSKEEGLKGIILEDIVSATPLSEADRELIQNQEGFDRENPIHQGFKIRIEDDQVKPNAILSSVFNKKTLNRFFNQYLFMENIQSHMERNNKKLYGKGRGYLKNINQEQGVAEILIYSTENRESKSLKELIIDNLANCRDLEETEVQALKTPEAEAEGIYDSKYISNACQIDIEDELLKTTEENEIEKLFDIYFKQEIADQVNKPNLNLDKHMSVYLKVQDMTKGRIGVILADTRSQKEPALIEALEIFRNTYFATDLNKETIEKAYGVQYINLGVALIWDDNRFQSGGEFDKSFALIDEILKDPKRRTAWIDRANQYRRNSWKFQEALPNDSNTIIRSRQLSSFFMIDIFTLTESPKESIQSHLLDWIDSRIKSIKSYSAIKYKKSINDFEEERILKQGLKIIEMYDNRFKEGGSLSSYYDNSKAINPLLDDADFKRKVITKINDYQKTDEEFKKTIDFVFSTDNLENIKIKAQGFSTGYYFQLVVYELYPPGESDSTNPSADESAEPAADGESEVSGESPTDGASPVDGD